MTDPAPALLSDHEWARTLAAWEKARTLAHREGRRQPPIPSRYSDPLPPEMPRTTKDRPVPALPVTLPPPLSSTPELLASAAYQAEHDRVSQEALRSRGPSSCPEQEELRRPAIDALVRLRLAVTDQWKEARAAARAAGLGVPRSPKLPLYEDV